MKDGPEGATIASRLEQAEVGIDEDGDLITSCIVVPVEGPISAAPANRKHSGKQRLALDCLADLVVDGKPLPPEWNMPTGIFAVPAFKWRAEPESRGILDTESSNPRARWQELKTGLMACNAVSERDGAVWKV